MIHRSLCLLAAALLAGCHREPPVAANAHYVVGSPYQAGGLWWYPGENYSLDQTGLAAVLLQRHAALTSNGEVYDPTAMAAAHATLQLPAIARVTNLENGRSAMVRVNDRGTPTPHRLVQLTPRVAELLGILPDGVAQVRLTVLPAESHAAAEDLPGAPSAQMAAAPRAAVSSLDLPPPAGARSGGGHPLLLRASANDTFLAPLAPPVRLPEQITKYPAAPGRLWVRLDSFQSYQYAASERAKLAGLASSIVTTSQGRTHAYRVMLGPFGSVAEADKALDQAIAAGVLDAQIVVQ